MLARAPLYAPLGIKIKDKFGFPASSIPDEPGYGERLISSRVIFNILNKRVFIAEINNLLELRMHSAVIGIYIFRFDPDDYDDWHPIG